MESIGKNIASKRKELRMTQEELAKKMGYKSKSTINKIELGINDIPQSKIVKFAEVLNTTPTHLMGWEKQFEEAPIEKEEQKKPITNDGLSDNMKALIDFAQSVPEHKAELVLRVMKSILEAD